MTFICRAPRLRVRPWLAALGPILLLLSALAGPVGAQSGPTQLGSPSVSPRTGDTTTVVTFTVVYLNHEGSAPAYVRVLIDASARVMQPGQGEYKGGILYTYASTLTAGTHTITFESADTRKFTDSLAAGTVVITVPPVAGGTGSGSTGSSAGSGGSTSSGTRPAGGASSTITSAGGSAETGRPAGGSTGSTGSTGSGDLPAGTATATGTAAEVSSPSSAGHATPGAGSSGAAATGSASSGGSTTGPSGSTGAGGTNAAREATVAGGLPPDERPGAGRPAGDIVPGLGTAPPYARILPAVIGATAATTLLFAFLFFGKRRRDGDPTAPDDLLAAAAATGIAGIGGGFVVGQVPVVADEEAALPRWRRPSLMAARKSDPLRSTAVDVKLSFDHGLVGPLDGHERRRLRYRLVHLLDGPDELRSTEIGMLDEGDEVQLLERSGTYWRVLCPDGQEGWLHQMTLGDAVDETATAEGEEQADWSRVDTDVLDAYLRSRGRD